MDGLIATPVFEQLGSLADATRGRLLLLLDRHELRVSELCEVLRLPQSTVSRHLKALLDGGWVVTRREGTSHLYAMAQDALPPSARRLWVVVREQTAGLAAGRNDARRLQRVLANRRARSEAFFSTAARGWDRLRQELFGNWFHLSALVGFADASWVVGDLGCGTGQVSAALAPFVDHVVAVDAAPAMLQAARARLHDVANVELRTGRLEALPIKDDELDAATLMLVLHHVAEPERVLAETARALKPGGRLVVVDMLPHDREDYRRQMGHVWLGFAGEQLQRWMVATGFASVRIVPLAPDAQASGPPLFIATARAAS